VLGDRYHLHILKTVREVRHAVNYLENNAHHHYGLVEPDPYTGAFLEPGTWLLRRQLE
jgi:hypothetical protein